MIDHNIAREMRRLARREQQFKAFRSLAMKRGDTRRALRATELMTLAYSKQMSIVMGEVSQYQDS